MSSFVPIYGASIFVFNPKTQDKPLDPMVNIGIPSRVFLMIQ